MFVEVTFVLVAWLDTYFNVKNLLDEPPLFNGLPQTSNRVHISSPLLYLKL